MSEERPRSDIQLNNSLTFSGKSMRPGSVWGISNQTVETLGITIDIRPREAPVKGNNKTIILN